MSLKKRLRKKRSKSTWAKVKKLLAKLSLLRYVKWLVLVVVIGFLMKGFFKKEGPVVIPGTGTPVTLKDDESAVAGLAHNKVTLVTRNADGTVTSKTRFVPPEGGVKLTIRPDGTTQVRVKDKGFTMSPNLGVTIDGGPRIGLYLTLAYYRRLGIGVGAGFGKEPRFTGYGALSYQPDWRLRNTALLVGMDNQRHFILGAKVRF